jgi:threonyl-tRNA synthetase
MERLSSADIKVSRSIMTREEAVAMFSGMNEKYKVFR